MRTALKITFIMIMMQLLLTGCSSKDDPVFIVAPSATFSITVTPFNASLLQGTTQNYTATKVDQSGTITDVTNQVQWESSQTSIASVNSSGVASSISVGDTIIKATLDSVSGSAALNVHNKSLSAISVSPPLAVTIVGLDVTLAATAKFSDNSTQDITNNATWSSDNTAIATVNSLGVAAPLSQGITQINANFNGHSDTAQINVLNASPTALTIQPGTATIPTGTNIDFKALLSLSNGDIIDVTENMQWTSNDSTIATVSNNTGIKGRATSIGNGTTNIAAGVTLSGTHYETLAELTVTAVEVTRLQITPQDIRVPKGTYGRLKAIAYFTDGSAQDVTALSAWNTVDNNIGQIISSGANAGFSYATREGNTEVTATFSGVTANTQATVTAATLQRIEVNPANQTVAKGVIASFTATGIFSDFSKRDITLFASWTSSDENIAVMDGRVPGRTFTNNPGAASITATFEGVSGNGILTVTNATQNDIVISPANASIYLGAGVTYHADAIYTDGSHQNITSESIWLSADPTIIDFNGQNIASSKGVGNTTVSAHHDGDSDTTSIEVTDAIVSGLEVAPLEPAVAKGHFIQFSSTARLSDSSTQDVTNTTTWTSSDESIATIDTDGLAHAHNIGTTTITSSTSPYNASTTLTVTDAVLESIMVLPKGLSLPTGVQQQYSAVGFFSDGVEDITQFVIWSSSASNIATISNSLGSEGQATTLTAGNTTLNAAYNGLNVSTNLTVTGASLQSISVNCIDTTIAAQTTTQCIAAGHYSNGSAKNITTDATWTSDDDTIATVSNAPSPFRTVYGAKNGSANITATLSGISGSELITVIEVTLNSITVTSPNDQVAINNTEQFSAVATYSNGAQVDITYRVQWSSSREAVLAISNQFIQKGLATGISVGQATVEANFHGIIGSKQLTVITGEAELEQFFINCDSGTHNGPVNLDAGETSQCGVTAVLANGDTVNVTADSNWTSDDTSIMTVTNPSPADTGMVEIKAIAQGKTTLRVEYKQNNTEYKVIVH